MIWNDEVGHLSRRSSNPLEGNLVTTTVWHFTLSISSSAATTRVVWRYMREGILLFNFLSSCDETVLDRFETFLMTDPCDFGALKRSKIDVFDDIDNIASFAMMWLLLDFFTNMQAGAGAVYPWPALESLTAYPFWIKATCPL
ncbi:hypothetical protein Vadar_008333 [Vaccinium darrowii]|uniref:Uncharacterized protein n=1 Tax=Vaccinium darrowii TaxID=229202 RepID=A0ACB7Z2L1_9ERIC|nr:hypothetical protein Vadar_008333 [Vaccinium darrowii]